MELARNVIIVLSGLSGFILAIVAILAWKKRNVRISSAVLFLSVAGMIYCFGYMAELCSNTLEEIRFWLHIQYLGISYIPAAWIILAEKHTQVHIKNWETVKVVLITISTITLILSSTFDIHPYYYKSLTLNPSAPFPVAKIEPGVWYIVHNTFNNISAIFGNILYIIFWRRAEAHKKQQAFVFFLSSFFPWTMLLIYLSGGIPWGLDPSPIAFIVPGVLYGWAIFNLGLFEVAPLAKQLIFQRFTEGILIFDRNGVLVDFNAASNKLFPKIKRTDIGKKGQELFANFPKLLELLDAVKRVKEILVLEDNSQYQMQKTILSEATEKTEIVGYMLVFQDITYYHNIVTDLQIEVGRDSLTGSLNRNKLTSEVEILMTKMQADENLAILMIDVDYFKQINDTYGHLIGDEVLKIFSQICQDNLRHKDIFGRYGGDEFIAVLPYTKEEEALIIAKRIRKTVASRELVLENDTMLRLTTSIGVAVSKKQEFGELANLIRQADQALYRAKDAGRNQVQI